MVPTSPCWIAGPHGSLAVQTLSPAARDSGDPEALLQGTPARRESLMCPEDANWSSLPICQQLSLDHLQMLENFYYCCPR